jgi:hypothetical protein
MISKCSICDITAKQGGASLYDISSLKETIQAAGMASASYFFQCQPI